MKINVDTPNPGFQVRQVGSDMAPGDKLLSAGQTIQPADVGLLASIGCVNVSCYAKPVVGVMSTGNELVEPSVLPTGSQIRDSNRPSLLAAFSMSGYEVVDLGIVPDTAESVESAFESAVLACDVIVTSGGVSV